MAVQGYQGRKVHMQLFTSDQSWSYLASSKNIAGFLLKTATQRNSTQDFRKFLLD